MRFIFAFILFLFWRDAANALTPLPDNSPAFFAGEWSGAGDNGSYCYLNLSTDGRGLVLIDAASGDWRGARIHWHNQRQGMVVDKIIPLPFEPHVRIAPLERVTVSTRFNQSLTLNWGASADLCYLRKIESTANNLTRARNVMKQLPSLKGAQ